MRTAEEIYESVMDDNLTVHATIVIAINEARKEAIEECAKKAKVKESIEYLGYKKNNCSKALKICVDKNSILSLIKELK